MEKHDFDLCKSNCTECSGINIKKVRENGVFKCLNTSKVLKQEMNQLYMSSL